MENANCVLSDRPATEHNEATVQYAANQSGRWFVRKKEYNRRTKQTKWSKWQEFYPQWIPGYPVPDVTRVPSEKDLGDGLSGPTRKWWNTLPGEQFIHT
jgi:hypothetical protein